MVNLRLFIDDHQKLIIGEDIKDKKYEPFICPITGKSFDKRRPFWNFVRPHLKPTHIKSYDISVHAETEENKENLNKLFHKCDIDYLYKEYFKGEKIKAKELEDLIGLIDLEVLIILVKIWRKEATIEDYIGDNQEENIEEKVEEVESVEEETVDESVDSVEEEEVEPVEEPVEDEEDESVEGDDENTMGLQTNLIINEDCIEGMKKLADESVGIIIADPPYNIGKDFGNNSDKQKMTDYLEWCDKWIEEGFRILKPNGTMFIYGFSEILAFIRVRIDLSYNVRWLVWHYTNKNTPTARFWCRSHESILCCSKDKKPIFNRDDVREPYTEGYVKNAAGKTRKATKGRFSNGETETIYKAHENGALPRDVIKMPALAGGAGKKERVDHPTQKPLDLCEKLIKSSMNKEEENLMVVPFAGSGSECVAAKHLGVNFIGYEINEEYVELCKSRLSEIA